MKAAPLPPDERKRVEILRECGILDTDAEEDFDALVRLGSLVCKTPMGIITLVDADRQWFKSRIGMTASQTPRDYSLCAYTILHHEPFVIEDTHKDDRFRDNPLVVGPPYIRSYAGVAMRAGDDRAVGTIAVMDREPRRFMREHKLALMDLARQASALLELRRKIFELRETATAREEASDEIRRLNGELRRRVRDLQLTNQELEAFSYTVSHDLRAPLRAIDTLSDVLLEDESDRLSDAGKEVVRRLDRESGRVSLLVDDLLRLSRVGRSELAPEMIDVSALAREVLEGLRRAAPERSVEVVIEPGHMAWADPGLMRVVLENLLGNAWKYTKQRPDARIEFGAERDGGQTTTYFVRDNGVGFDMASSDRLFRPFQRLHGAGFEGTGVGLATVRRIVERHGGRVWAEGATGKGATFYFTLAAPS